MSNQGMMNAVSRLLIRSLAGGAVLLFLSQSALSRDEAYNLTGVMGSSGGKLFAVIENANGKQRLITEGDELDGGLVRHISAEDKSVLLEFPDRELRLTLTGSNRPVAPEKPELVTNFEQVPDKNLDRATFQALVQLSREADSLEESETAARLNELLDLPENARVIAFDMRQAGSTRQLLKMMSPRLEATESQGGALGNLVVKEGSANKRFYFNAEAPPESR
jgi:hypothetical protein